MNTIIKESIDHLIDILNSQNQKIIACDVDLIVYNRKLIIVSDANSTAYLKKKVDELKAIKARAEETVEVINKQIDEELKKGKKKNTTKN